MLSDIKAKEEELMKMNQELEQKRLVLKQQYVIVLFSQQIQSKQEYKQSSAQKPTQEKKNTVQLNYEPIEKPQTQGIIDEIVQRIEFKQNFQQEQEEEPNEFDHLQDRMQSIKQYDDDKQAQITELHLLIDEQSKIPHLTKFNLEKIQRIQNIKIEAIKQELEAFVSENTMKETLLSEMESKGRNIVDQSKKYHSQIDQLNERLDGTKKKTNEAVAKQKALDKENKNLLKEIDNVKKQYRTQDQEMNKKDLKINRTQEDINKIRLQVQQQKLSQNEKYGDLHQAIDQLKKDNNKIEAQMLELLNSLKKQLKLIDVLKRQKVHLIAAKMFEFVEQDFVNTIEMGQKIQIQ